MTTYRGRTVAALSGLALLGGMVIGHTVLMPKDIAAGQDLRPPKTVVTPTPKAKPVDRYAPSKAWLHSGPEQQVEAYSGFVKAVGAGETCMRDVQHSYLGLFLTPKGEHGDVPSKLHPGQDHHFAPYLPGVCDDHPNADWPKVDPLFAEALAQDARETGTKGHDEAYFRTCLYTEHDTVWVVCPDGFVVVS